MKNLCRSAFWSLCISLLLSFQSGQQAPITIITDQTAYAPQQAIKVRLANVSLQTLDYVVWMEWHIGSQWLPLDMDVVSNTTKSYTTKRLGLIRKIKPHQHVEVSYTAYRNTATAPTLRTGSVQARFVVVIKNSGGEKETRIESIPILIKR